MEDTFEFIKGYENLYKINRNGEIYSCRYNKVMAYNKTQDDYYFVMLSKEGKRSKGRIHRLLALQYLENTDNLPEVDHIDRNRLNNNLTNLRWVTRRENRKNRSDIIEQMTEEQKQERLNKIKEYKKNWSTKDRREKGCKLKSEMNKTKDPEYYKKYKEEKKKRLQVA